MTHHVSDLLVLRLLMKEVGFELNDDRTPPVVPLFETVGFAPGAQIFFRHLEGTHVVPTRNRAR